MIEFERITPDNGQAIRQHLLDCGARSCEYTFANLAIWGRQKAAFVEGFLVLFSQFDRRSIYPFPVGRGPLKPVLDTLIADARERGLLFRISAMGEKECKALEELYPGQFHFHSDRDGADYVYRISDLAELKGKRYQSKRNFANRFWANHPDAQVLPLEESTRQAAEQMLETWFSQRAQIDPLADFHLEKQAIKRAFQQQQELGMEGLVLMEQGRVLAMCMGSRLSQDTFDVHFEKALDGVDGAYAAINRAFAEYLQGKYPQLLYLNREDDMGIPGLRQAKLSYHPDHLVEKYWARLWEDEDAH